MPNSAWVQQPSMTLCVEQCGAQCCRAPGYILVSRLEAQRLQQRHREDIVFRTMPGDALRLVMNFSENGGQCPMLGADAACAIYPYRPVACHHFPSEPDPRCAVWPG